MTENEAIAWLQAQLHVSRETLNSNPLAPYFLFD